MRKILGLVIFLFVFCLQTMCADEVLKFSSINFDTSNSVVFLAAQDTVLPSNLKNVKLIRLSNPNRVYFDIDDAILTFPKQNYQFSTGELKEIKISQFSTNPNIIRVVMYLEPDFNSSKIKVLKVKNNLVIKFKEDIVNTSYFQNNYRDEHLSDLDFYEYTSISSQVITKTEQNIKDVNRTSTNNDKVLNQIQQAFEASNIPENMNTVYNDVNVSRTKKDLKLNTKYYLNDIIQKPSGVLITGFGSVGVEKPIFLASPDRIVFDLPNTLVRPELRNKELKINQTDFVKIGQFEANKARIVVSATDVKNYYPIFSKDSQTLLIVDAKTFDLKSLAENKVNATYYSVDRVNDYTSDLKIGFDGEIVYSVERGNNAIYVYIFNAMNFNEQNLKKAVDATALSGAKIEPLVNCGLKVTIPMEISGLANTYLGADGKILSIRIKSTKKQPVITQPIVKIKRKFKNNKTLIMLDAGHGGVDYGAIRSGINEKDINLDVAKRVQSILERKGYNVLLTREADETLSLQERVDLAEKAEPEIFVSVHVNASEKPEITGMETHYYHDYSKDLAEVIQKNMTNTIKTSPNRGLFKSKFYVINHTTMPAVLVEIGFISNDDERTQLIGEKRKQKTAEAIAEGIENYFKLQQ